MRSQGISQGWCVVMGSLPTRKPAAGQVTQKLLRARVSEHQSPLRKGSEGGLLPKGIGVTC